jgi:uncharacterized protein (TIGR02996 family)
VDDEFLAAVLSAPADEPTRLAYADWLDRRADPRGRYLRAEADAFRPGAARPGAVADLPRLARGLDPVWVARVSRPPAGVCCPGVRFTDNPGRTRPRLGPAAFSLLDRWLGPDWPAAYRAFLLNYNGGRPEPGRLALPDGRRRVVSWLLSVWSPDGEPEDFDLDLVSFAQDHLVGSPPVYGPGIGIPADCIKVGTFEYTGEGDALCLAVTGERKGWVYSVVPAAGALAPPPDDEPVVSPIAASFPEFLALLH